MEIDHEIISMSFSFFSPNHSRLVVFSNLQAKYMHEVLVNLDINIDSKVGFCAAGIGEVTNLAK